MALLSAQDQQVVRTHFAGLRHDVRLLFFTQTIGEPETAAIARQVLDEIAPLHERISLEG